MYKKLEKEFKRRSKDCELYLVVACTIIVTMLFGYLFNIYSSIWFILIIIILAAHNGYIYLWIRYDDENNFFNVFRSIKIIRKKINVENKIIIKSILEEMDIGSKEEILLILNHYKARVPITKAIASFWAIFAGSLPIFAGILGDFKEGFVVTGVYSVCAYCALEFINTFIWTKRLYSVLERALESIYLDKVRENKNNSILKFIWMKIVDFFD